MFFNRKPKFVEIAWLLAQAKQKSESPDYVEKIKRDLEEAQTLEAPVTTMAAEKVASFTFQVPNLASFPPSTATIEVGCVKTSGFAINRANFDTSFSDVPQCLYASFGYWNFPVPIPKLELRTFSAWGLSVTILWPTDWIYLRLPSMSFMMKVDSQYIEIANIVGDNYGTYLAIGQ